MTKDEFQVGFFQFLEATADQLEKVSDMPCVEMKHELRRMTAHLRKQVAMAEEKRREDGMRQWPA